MHAVFAFLLLIASSIGGGAYAMQTGDPYLDAASAIVSAPKPADETFRIIDQGRVDVNRYYPDGNTLMHYAAVAGRADLMEGLIARGGRLDIKRRQSDAATPVELARRPEIVAYLTRIGAMQKPWPGGAQSAAPSARKPAAAPNPTESPRRKMCNQRHYSSSALCSDSTCKMREYRKWQTCLKTGSYY